MSNLGLEGLLLFESHPVEPEDFQDIITQVLHKPSNAIGLGGPAKGGDEWEKWLDRMLESCVLEKYTWNEEELKYRRHRTRDIIRQEVIALAAKERAKLRTFQEVLAKMSATDSGLLSLGKGTFAVPSQPNQIPEDGPRLKGDSKKRPFMKEDDMEDEILQPEKQTSLPSPAKLVFETRLEPSNKVKLIYAADTPCLPRFLQRVREKWCLQEKDRVGSFDIEIGGKIFEVDPSEERDWVFVLETATQSGALTVTVFIKAVSDTV